MTAETQPVPQVAPPDPPTWFQFLTVRPLVGYRDNLLFSNRNREASWLYGGNVEATLWRSPADGHHFTGLLFLEHFRYPDGRMVDAESIAYLTTQYRRDLNPTWQFGGDVNFLLQDQVFDVSTTEPTPVPIQARGQQLALRPGVTWRLATNRWLGLTLEGQRQFFERPLDDYWELGPLVEAGRRYGNRSEVALRYYFRRRWYDERNQFTADGFVVADTSLHYDLHEAKLAWKHHFDAARNWRGDLELGTLRNLDNGSGYFDHWRHQAATALRYRKDPWEAAARLRWSYYDYDLQTVLPDDPRRREKHVLGASVRGSRLLARQWRIYAEYALEVALSNRTFEEYRVHTIRTGLQWDLN